MKDNITPFEEFIRDTMEHAEMQAPDIWGELSSQVAQPSSGNIFQSTVFKGVVTTLVVGGVAAALWFSQPDTAVERSTEQEVVIENPNVSGQSSVGSTEIENAEGANAVSSVIAAGESGSAETDGKPTSEQIFKGPGNAPKNATVVQQDNIKNATTAPKLTSNSGTGNPIMLNQMFNDLVQIYLSDTVVCKNDVCIISTSNMVLFDKFYWEIDGNKMAHGSYTVTYKAVRTGNLTVKLHAVKDGHTYSSSRYIRVVGHSTGMDLYTLGDKNVRAMTSVEDIQKIAWHFGDNRGWVKGEGHDMDHHYDHFGTYLVQAALIDGNGCADTASKKLDLYKKLEIVNIFTPWTKDGVNDYFDISGEDIEEFHLTVRSAIGDVVFESNTIVNKWDGADQATGQMVPKGTYIYQIVYSQGVGPVTSTSGKIEVR